MVLDLSYSVIHNPQPEEADNDQVFVTINVIIFDNPYTASTFVNDQVSFEQTNYIRFRPASKLVVKSLTRNVYEKIRCTDEKCMICLEEFNNGGLVVTLPCQHTFDEECVVKWFETSHVCPLCRFELPCEDQ